MVYVYFVSYSYGYPHSMFGYGSCEVPFHKKVTHYQDIRGLKDAIVDTFKHQNVIVLNYKLMRLQKEEV